MIIIDLNSDVGEGIGNEAALLPYLTSCNIACGGHAGTDKTMLEVLALANKFSVKAGAHPSYPDIKNFGRLEMDMSIESLEASIISQILRLKNIAAQQGIRLHHVKPHGALYNKAAYDMNTAKAVIRAVTKVDSTLKLYAPYKSLIAHTASDHLQVVIEGFADRAYHSDYSLVSRKKNNALINSVEDVLDHVIPMVQNEKLKTIDGKELPIKLETLCVHGDTDGALLILKNLYKVLQSINIKIA